MNGFIEIYIFATTCGVLFFFSFFVVVSSSDAGIVVLPFPRCPSSVVDSDELSIPTLYKRGLNCCCK